MRARPHSRQLLLCRGVIRLQNGHILRAIGFRGFAVSVSPAAFRRRPQGMPAVCGGGAGTGEKRVPSVPAFSRCSGTVFSGISGRSCRTTPHIRNSDPFTMTGWGRRFCAGLLIFRRELPPAVPNIHDSTCKRDGQWRETPHSSAHRTFMVRTALPRVPP